MNGELAAFQAEVRGAFAEMRQGFAALEERVRGNGVLVESVRDDVRQLAEAHQLLDQRIERHRQENDAAHQEILVLLRTSYRDLEQRKLLDECDLWCIVSLPAGAFVNAGAGVKTNLLFFTKGRPTESIWYYDLSQVKVGKKSPLTIAHFEEFFRLLLSRSDGEHSWTVERKEIEARGYDLKAVNPNAKKDEDTRTPENLLDLLEAKGREVTEAIAALRGLLGRPPSS